MARFFYHDNKDTAEDFTDEHDSGEQVSEQHLLDLGVFYRKIESMDELNDIAKKRGYKNRDEITLNLDSFSGDVEAFNKKMAMFYTEHYHEDEEIRYIVDGEGYFDVRGKDERWIRAQLDPNDLLVLPAGIFHRFTLSSNLKAVKAIRLFKDEPKWEAINRDTGRVSDARTEYVNSITV